MNFKLTLTAVLAAMMIIGCARQEEPAPAVATEAPPSFDTTEQRLSYGIAYGLGQRMVADGVPVDAAAFSAGFSDALAGEEPRLNMEEVGAEMQAYQEEQQAQMQAGQQAVALENAEQGAAFLAENAARDGVVVLESGLQYKVLTEGDGARPGPTDEVEVHYRGTLIDGTEFDSSYARNSTVSFGVNQVIAGWTEALQLMPAGSKWMLYIPPELAYGPGGAGAVIGPNATLVFEVELIGINPNPAG